MIAPPGIPNITSTPSAAEQRRIASPPVIFIATPSANSVSRRALGRRPSARRRRTRGSSPRRPGLRPRSAAAGRGREGEAVLERLGSCDAAEALREQERRREQHRARVRDALPRQVARRRLGQGEEPGPGRRELAGGNEPPRPVEDAVRTRARRRAGPPRRPRRPGRREPVEGLGQGQVSTSTPGVPLRTGRRDRTESRRPPTDARRPERARAAVKACRPVGRIRVQRREDRRLARLVGCA